MVFVTPKEKEDSMYSRFQYSLIGLKKLRRYNTFFYHWKVMKGYALWRLWWINMTKKLENTI